MPISTRLAALLADRSQVLTRKRDILYLFGDVDLPEDDEEALEAIDAEPSSEMPSQARDLSALLILERLSPSTGAKVLASASHDEVNFAVGTSNLKNKATVEDILNLRRLGVCVEDGDLMTFV